LVPTVGAGAAAVIWGVGGTATPAVTIVSFVVATAGIGWMLVLQSQGTRQGFGRVGGTAVAIRAYIAPLVAADIVAAGVADGQFATFHRPRSSPTLGRFLDGSSP